MALLAIGGQVTELSLCHSSVSGMQGLMHSERVWLCAGCTVHGHNMCREDAHYHSVRILTPSGRQALWCTAADVFLLFFGVRVHCIWV